MTIGEIRGSSPSKLPVRKDQNYLGNLNVKDIDGSAPGSKRRTTTHSSVQRSRAAMNPNDISDIEGAKCNTLKKGL